MLKSGKGKLHQLSILIKLLNQVQLYRAGTEYRLLILDGHTSHFNWEFFDYCLNAKILLLCLPPTRHTFCSLSTSVCLDPYSAITVMASMPLLEKAMLG